MDKIFRVIDTETCGFDGGIVEIASVDYAGPLVAPKNPLQTLVKPDRPISFGAMAIHHITEKMVEFARPLESVLPMFTHKQPDWTDDAPTSSPAPDYFVAHNAEFDRGMLPDTGKPWICTLKLARHLFPALDGHGNQFLRYALGLDDRIKDVLPPGLHAHRALYDVYCTSAIFGYLAYKMEWDVDAMVRITEAPSLLHYVKWGKYAKASPLKTYEEVARTDPGYFQWALGGMSDLGEDRRHTITHWMNHWGHPLTKSWGRR